jgi:hypothetical protein
VALACVVSAAALLFWVHSGAVLPLVALLTGAASGTLPPLAMGLAARALTSRSQGISVHETYTSFGLGAGPFLGGLAVGLLDTPRAALLPCVAFALFGVLAVLRVRPALQLALR